MFLITLLTRGCAGVNTTYDDAGIIELTNRQRRKNSHSIDIFKVFSYSRVSQIHNLIK